LDGLRTLGGQLSRGATSTQGAIQRLWDGSLGNMPVFQSPARRAQEAQRARNVVRSQPTRARPATNPLYLADMAARR
jgi:hypothetical protein